MVNIDRAVSTDVKVVESGLSELWRWFLRRAQEYSQVTGLHGYRHIGREDMLWWERAGWAFFTLGALVAAIVLLWIAWGWNAATPTLTVIESTHFPIWNIPFPAVTLCNVNKISRMAADNFTRNMVISNNVTREELLQLFQRLVRLKTLNKSTNTTNNDRLVKILDDNNITAAEMLRKLAPTCEDMIERCSWKGALVRCETLFQPIISSEGFCCSFNYYGHKKHAFSAKFAHSHPLEPRKVTACGYGSALTVLINPMTDDYHATALSSYGVRAMVHSPYDFPDENSETKLLSAEQEVFLSVTPQATYSTPGVQDLDPEYRQCYFSDEGPKLSTMQEYSFTNCLAQCRSRLSCELCKCVPYNYLSNDSSTCQTCNLSDITCLSDNRKLITGSAPGWNESHLMPLFGTPCDCLPDCELEQYPTEASSGNFSRRFSMNSISFFKEMTMEKHTIVHVYFSDLVTTHYRRDIYLNWHNLLASFGGLLGLFIGFSLVSGFELIYYFTIRVFFDRFAQSSDQTEQSKDLNNDNSFSDKYARGGKKVHYISVIGANFEPNKPRRPNKLTNQYYNNFTL